MNPSDVQSDSDPTYFDPEEFDMSEQQFAASLEISAERPQFEIDALDTQPEGTDLAYTAEDPAPIVPVLEKCLAGEQVVLSTAVETEPPADTASAAPEQPAAPPDPDWR